MIVLRFRRRARNARAQSLVEFAFILPIFLLMLFGLVDMGRLVYANTTLSQAAREAARVASVEAYWVGSTDASCGRPGGPTCPANEAGLKADALAAANRMMAPFGAIPAGSLHISCTAVAATPPSGSWTSPPNGCGTAAVRQAGGSRVSVRIALDFRPITPVISQLFSSIGLAGAATMTIN